MLDEKNYILATPENQLSPGSWLFFGDTVVIIGETPSD